MSGHNTLNSGSNATVETTTISSTEGVKSVRICPQILRNAPFPVAIPFQVPSLELQTGDGKEYVLVRASATHDPYRQKTATKLGQLLHNVLRHGVHAEAEFVHCHGCHSCAARAEKGVKYIVWDQRQRIAAATHHGPSEHSH